MGKLDRNFYARPTLTVARDMLGKYLHFHGKIGRIVETEAYLGPEDLASHARFGPKGRSRIMFGPAGYSYVYLTYGMYHMLNIIAEGEGVPGGVLIRAIEPIEGIEGATNGPGRLTRSLGITLIDNGTDLTVSPTFYLEDRGDKIMQIVEAKRVGIDYAGEYRDKPWRFFIKDNSFVSKKI